MKPIIGIISCVLLNGLLSGADLFDQLKNAMPPGELMVGSDIREMPSYAIVYIGGAEKGNDVEIKECGIYDLSNGACLCVIENAIDGEYEKLLRNNIVINRSVKFKDFIAFTGKKARAYGRDDISIIKILGYLKKN